MNKRTPVLGETLYSLNIGNAAWGKTPQVLTPVTVTKVGRKYFKCKPEGKYWSEVEYHLEDWSEHSNYSPNSKLYETQQEWEDEKESNFLSQEISKNFSYIGVARKIPLEKLRAIKAILDE